MLRIWMVMTWYAIIGFFGTCKSTAADQTPVTFTFKEYQYKDSPKNEMTFREFETACEQSSACNQMNGLTRTRCVRECVSPSCYKELYQSDPVITYTAFEKVTVVTYILKRRQKIVKT